MKSFFAALVILLLVFLLLIIPYYKILENLDKLILIQEEYSKSNKKFDQKENKDLVLKSIKNFEKNKLLFSFFIKKNITTKTQENLQKLLLLIENKNYSEYIISLDEYSSNLMEMKKEVKLNLNHIF